MRLFLFNLTIFSFVGCASKQVGYYPERNLSNFSRPIHQTSASVIIDFNNISSCTQRIWPGYSWSGYTVVAVDEKKPLQNAIQVDQKRSFKIPNDEIPQSQSATKATFSFMSVGDQKWMAVNRSFSVWEPTPHAVFALGVHEAFHRIAQADWEWRIGGMMRGTQIPPRWEPRIYRAYLYKNLKDYFLENRTESLRRAKYWYSLWKTNFPHKNESTTDGYEGTARYSEIIGQTLAAYSCEMDENFLKQMVQKRVAKEPNLIDFAGRISLDSEGYPIGSTAAFILRWTVGGKNWEGEAAKAETPVDILLKDVAPLSEEPDPALADLL